MIEYSIDEQQRLLQVRMYDWTGCDALEKHLAAIHQDPRFHPTLRTLCHVHKNVDGPHLSELPDAKRLLEATAQSPNSLRKWAVVIPPEFKRMIVEYFLKSLELKPVEMQLFGDEATARAWLNE